MKYLGPVSEEDMKRQFPDLFDALHADPEDTFYCMNCDGLRTHSTADCPYPEPPWMRTDDV